MPAKLQSRRQMTDAVTPDNWLAHDIDMSLHRRRCQAATLVPIGGSVERFGDFPVSAIGEVGPR